jgi:glycine cleavage system H protein
VKLIENNLNCCFSATNREGGLHVKEINELSLPEDVRYTNDHEWAKAEGEKVRVGLSDYAQDQLGDIVFVELPEAGEAFEKGETFGTVESTKAVAELYMPVGGEIIATNTDLIGSPELMNESPYDKGWVIDVKPNDSAELDALMSIDTYRELLKGIE